MALLAGLTGEIVTAKHHRFDSSREPRLDQFTDRFKISYNHPQPATSWHSVLEPYSDVIPLAFVRHFLHYLR